MEYRIEKFDLKEWTSTNTHTLDIEKIDIPEPSALEAVERELGLNPSGVSLHELAAKHYARKYDECVFGAFESLGYSRDDVLRLGAEGRIRGLQAAGPGGLLADEWYMDDKFLFSLNRAVGPIYPVDSGYAYNISWHCKFAPGTNPIMED